MKKNLLALNTLILFCLMAINGAFAQNNSKYTIYLLSGNIDTEKFTPGKERVPEIFDNDDYWLIQFKEIPNNISNLNQSGVVLYDYIPDFTYRALIKSGTSRSRLMGLGVKEILPITTVYKLDPLLIKKEYPSHAEIEKGSVDVLCHFYEISKIGVEVKNISKFASIISRNQDHFHLRIPFENIEKIASIKEVKYIEVVEPEPVDENRIGRSMHGGNVINNGINSTLNGQGVTVTVGDGGLSFPHLDFTGRFTARGTAAVSSHATHVTGIVGGAGVLNHRHEGHASGARLISYNGTSDISAIPNIYTPDGVRVTNHSLGWGCNGDYNSSSRTVDNQVRTYNTLIHVFSAGNSGTENCNKFPTGWGNITGSFKVGKNVLSVANLTSSELASSSSSRGPLFDGRIKPDISALGSGVWSTENDDTYSSKSGTSMAAPAVSGITAQLIQSFRTENNNQDPKSGLLLGLMLNSADDIGNAGPDFIYGFGKINAARTHRNIVAKNYQTNTVTNGQTRNHTITVPANTRQLKVMIYWVDPQGTVGAAKALVNDLDMVVRQGGTSVLPFVLNPSETSTALLNSPATRGVDRLNNKEQVVIDNPSGSYTVDVTGFAVPQGPQEYFLVYDFIQNNIEITHPVAGQALFPGENNSISWNAFGNDGSFTVQYSTNNGSTWTTISSTVSGSRRSLVWSVPSTISSGQILIRVSRSGLTATTGAVGIIPLPGNLSVDYRCQNNYGISWNAVANASAYRVYQLGTNRMELLGTTSTTNFVITSPSTVQNYFSVAAIVNGIEGKRANAVLKPTGVSACPGCPIP
ncbi:MAG: S8 family serine peptidase, partial [Cytophagales bacterium]